MKQKCEFLEGNRFHAQFLDLFRHDTEITLENTTKCGRCRTLRLPKWPDVRTSVVFANGNDPKYFRAYLEHFYVILVFFLDMGFKFLSFLGSK